MHPTLLCLRRLYGCNVCGEGGEYETLTLDCSLFELGSIVLDAWEMRLHSPTCWRPWGSSTRCASTSSPSPGPGRRPPHVSVCGPAAHPAWGSGGAAPPGPPPATSWAGSPGGGPKMRSSGSLPTCLERVPLLGKSGVVAGSLGDIDETSGAPVDERDVSGDLLGGPASSAGTGLTVNRASSLEEIFRLGHAASLPVSLGPYARSGEMGSGFPNSLDGYSTGASTDANFLGDSPEDGLSRRLDGLPGSLEDRSGRFEALEGGFESPGAAGTLPEGLTAWVIDVPEDFRGVCVAEQVPEEAPEEDLEADAPGDAGVGCGARWSPSGGQLWCAASGRGETMEQQVADALRCALGRLANDLRGVGQTLGSAHIVQLYLADMACFGAANAEYCRYFPAANPPARACMQAPLPANQHILLDILFPSPQTLGENTRRIALHVQSISEWAPACIGPYSQGVAWGPLIHMAGQIGLDPPTMTLVSGGPLSQSKACLRHSQAVAIAMGSDLQRGMLACNLFAAREDAARNLDALGDAVSQFLDGLPDMVAPAGLSPPAWEYRNLEMVSEEDDDEYVDPYLRLPDFPNRSWSPLLTYVVMGGLPRGAAVEVQPLAFSLLAPLTRDPVPRGLNGAHPTGTDDSDEESSSAAVPQWVAALTHGTRRWEFESLGGQVEFMAEFLSSSGFFRIHVSVIPPGGVSALPQDVAVPELRSTEQRGSMGWLKGAGKCMWTHVGVLLAESGLGVGEVVQATAFYNVNVVSLAEVALALDLGGDGPLEGLSSIPCVPTLAIGPSTSVQAAYQLQLMATTL
eukprot:jgi/Botrbrau1/22045/Bobra.0024s0057.2